MGNIIAMLLKYLPALLAFKDVTETYKKEQGADKPFYLSKRFWGVLITSAGGVAALFGVEISAEQATALTDNAVAVGGAIAAIYGVVMGVKGQIDAKKRA